MTNLKSEIRNLKLRSAFTLMELLIVITIISILAGVALSGLVSAVNDARVARTRAQINKIDALIMERYESYRTRPVPIRVPAGTPPPVAAQMRLHALRDLMRMELPDRRSDVVDGPCDYDPRIDAMGNPVINRMASPSLRNSYQRQAERNAGAAWATTGWTPSAQGSECLYLILSTMKDGDKSALDFFTPDEIGDLDGDGMKEILDGFGRPILFIRWPAGYTQQQPGPDGQWGVAGTDDDGNSITDDYSEYLAAGSDDIIMLTTLQTRNTQEAPDPFDPLGVDGPRYALKPLIASSGLDKEFDIFTDNLANPLHRYSPGSTDNNYPLPFNVFADGYLPGTVGDRDSDGNETWADNITNHFIEPQ